MSSRPPSVLVPLPDRDFDTTESSIAWRAFVDAGVEVTFATETGRVAACDQRLLRSGFFNWFPAGQDALDAYRAMSSSPAFRSPITYRDIDPADFDAVHLGGGHAQGMRQYLDSGVLRERVLGFHRQNKTIGAICHGSLIPARTIDPRTGASIIEGRRFTTLTRPIEKFAFRCTWFRVGRRYRTYWKYTETEVGQAVGSAGAIERGETRFGAFGYSLTHDEPMVVEDGHFLSARYPFDAPRYAEAFVRRLVDDRAAATP
ncbi:type 1 glutamine amidotransferase domain-containing protein [Actinomycetospora sp. C-140]